MAKKIIKKEYLINSLIDDLADFNFKFNHGQYDGKIPYETLMKLLNNSEAV